MHISTELGIYTAHNCIRGSLLLLIIQAYSCDFDYITFSFKFLAHLSLFNNLGTWWKTIYILFTEAPEGTKGMASLKPTVIMTRDGDSLKQKTVMGPGIEFEFTLKLNEVLDWKDKEEDPMFHTKV